MRTSGTSLLTKPGSSRAARVAPSDLVALDHERRAIFELDHGAAGSPRDVMIGVSIDEGRGGSSAP
jgi:hypothetical protein